MSRGRRRETTTHSLSEGGQTPAARLLLAASLLATAILVVVWEPWHGPILLTLLPAHGVDTGDLMVLPLVLVSAGLVGTALHGLAGAGRGGSTGRWAAVPAIGVGSLLLLVGAIRLADLDDHIGGFNEVLAMLLVASALWLLSELMAPRVHGSTGLIWVVGALILAGTVVDVLVVPSGTVFGVAVLAGSCAVLLRRRSAALAGLFGVIAVALIVASIASLTDLAGVDVLMAKDEGGAARSGALGVVLVAVGAMLAGGARSR